MKKYLPIIGVILVWSSAYPLIKIALVYMSPIVLAIIRLTVGGLLLAIYAKGFVYGVKEFVGAILNVALFMIFLNFGVMLSPNPALSATLIYTQPVFIVILSYFVFNERVNLAKILGVIIAISGAIYASGNVEINLGALISLIGGFIWAVGTVFYRKFLINRDVGKLNSFMALVSVPILSFFLPFHYYFTFSIEGILVAVVIGVTAQALGFIFWFTSIRKLGSFKASTLSLLVPPLSYMFSYLILGDIPSIEEIVGSSLVLLGILLTFKS